MKADNIMTLVFAAILVLCGSVSVAFGIGNGISSWIVGGLILVILGFLIRYLNATSIKSRQPKTGNLQRQKIDKLKEELRVSSIRFVFMLVLGVSTYGYYSFFEAPFIGIVGSISLVLAVAFGIVALLTLFQLGVNSLNKK